MKPLASQFARLAAIAGLTSAFVGIATDTLYDGQGGASRTNTRPPVDTTANPTINTTADLPVSTFSETTTSIPAVIGELTVDIGGIDLLVPGGVPQTSGGLSRPLIDLLVEQIADPEFLRAVSEFFDDAAKSGGSFLSDNFEVLVNAAGEYIVKPVIEGWLDEGGEAPSNGTEDAQTIYLEISNELELGAGDLTASEQALVSLALLRALGENAQTVGSTLTSGDNNVTVIVVSDGSPTAVLVPTSTVVNGTLPPAAMVREESNDDG